VRDRDAALAPNFGKPLSVRAIVRDMVGVAFYAKAGVAEDGWELMAEIAIGEKYDTQATCSYRTASSISATLRS
jgi:hypothetical protein